MGIERMTPLQRAYINEAAGEGLTMRRNVSAFQWVELAEGRPVDSRHIALSTTVLGIPFPVPFLIGPSSGQAGVRRQGDLHTYRAASRAGVAMCLSHFGASIDGLARSADGVLLRQVYYHSRRGIEDLIRRAEQAGARAVVVTADEPYAPGLTRYEQAVRQSVPEPLTEAVKCRLRPLLGRNLISAFDGDRPYRLAGPMPELTWDHIARLRDVCNLPLVVKGILTAEDAAQAVSYGFDGIVVSNHGGRSQDRLPATIEVLPEIVDAVRGRTTILIDSGFRHGTHIVKALALGADAVLVVRPIIWALAAFGEAGVGQVLDLLRNQMIEEMALRGFRTVADLRRAKVETFFA